ncbi:FecR domain-containing protein, partial [bacterium]|nr:FecR domain-containing protein [bacterium]
TAVLSEKKGTVQYHRLEDLQWQEAVLKQELVEKDRVRTLSRSYGNILFVDGSRVQMDENALVVIETVNKDVIRNASSVELLVLEGDVSTWINALHANPDFKVNAPGVGTNIRSRNFLTSRDKEKTTRFSNFDGEVDVIASGRSVTLADNEGTQVAYGKKPAAPRKLLESPGPVHPSEGLILPENRIAFRWEPVEKAAAYLIQVSRDRNFSRIEKILRVGNVQAADWEAYENGEYFWRIRAVDAEKLQGPFSETVAFSVRVDRTPPFLALTSPARDTVVFEPVILIRGKVEKGALVVVNGDTAESADGAFQHRVRLRGGRQQLLLSATDEAGNRSRMTRDIICNMGRELFTLEDGAGMCLNVNRVAVRGTVKPQVRLDIQGQAVETQGGTFTHFITLPEGSHQVAVRAESPDGHVHEQTLHILIDHTPPVIQIDDIPPFTDQETVPLTGSLSESAELTVDGNPVASAQQRFSCNLHLTEGTNAFLLQARDPAGNSVEKTVTLIRDTEPPQILSRSLSETHVTGGEVVRLRVEARDSGVGMARTCTAIVAVEPAGTQLSTLLKLNAETRGYEGSLSIPPESPGSLRFVKLYVSDYLGNSAAEP